MSFFEELVKESDAFETTKEEVINEIVSSYDEYVSRGGVENFLKNFIGNTQKKERKFTDEVSFWAYHEGCSTTNFSAFGWKWTNPDAEEYSYASHSYKGFDLNKIHREIVCRLKCITFDELHRLGFSNVVATDDTGNIGYKKYMFTIRW